MEKADIDELEDSPVTVTALCVDAAPGIVLPPPQLPSTSCATVWEEEEDEFESGGKEASDEEFEEDAWPESPHGQFVETCERKRRSSREIAKGLEDMAKADRARSRFLILSSASALALFLATVATPWSLVDTASGQRPQPKDLAESRPRPPLAHAQDEYHFPHLLDDFWYPIAI